MTTNRLARLSDEANDRVHPPQGNSDEDKAARQRFWIERGNAQLREEGRDHLHWTCRNGHYAIEHRGG